jgi:hypothetical protein
MDKGPPKTTLLPDSYRETGIPSRPNPVTITRFACSGTGTTKSEMICRSAKKASANIFMATADDSDESGISRGEIAGRTLEHDRCDYPGSENRTSLGSRIESTFSLGSRAPDAESPGSIETSLELASSALLRSRATENCLGSN